jgi:hypothetical protein
MDIAEAEEKVAKAPLGDRMITLIRTVRSFEDPEDHQRLRRAAARSGLGKTEIDAAFAVAARG